MPSSPSVPTTPAAATEFTITDAAIAQVKTIMAQQTLEADERNLRIFVEGGGCCGGVGFGLAFDRAQPDDAKFVRGDLTVVVDPQSFPFVAGATIDFVNTPEVQGFKVSAPPMPGGGCSSGSCGPSSSGGGGGCGSGGGGGGGGCGCGTGQGSGACGTGGGHEHGHAHGGHGHSHEKSAKKQGHGGGCC
jgi:iron-sulfur cluster assembly accessory protein